MPSQQTDPGWSFGSVYDLIDSDAHGVSSPTLTPVSRPLASALKDRDGGIRLGSFTKLYESLGFSQDSALAFPPLDSDLELSNSDDALLPSLSLEHKKSSEELTSSADDQIVTDTALSKKQRQKARKKAEKERLAAAVQAEKERLQLRMKLEALAEAAAKKPKPVQIPTKPEIIDTPTKPSRAQSRSNVSAKIRAPSPTPDAKQNKKAQSSEKPPKTPKARRATILKISSIPAPVTPQPLPEKENSSIEEAVLKVAKFTANGDTAPVQQPTAPQLAHLSQTPQFTTPVRQGQGLVPRTVRPVTVPRQSQTAVPQMPTTPTPTPQAAVQTPAAQALSQALTISVQSGFTIRPQTDRHFNLFHKLLDVFPDDRKWLVSPMRMINQDTASEGLHIFVDNSNIMIGFKDMLRHYNIPSHQFEMSFDSLALLMERRRPVAKRVFAGSHREANPLPHVTKLVDTSKAVGYDSVMQEQVLIVREDSEKKKFFNDVKKLGWHKATQLRSGSGSDSETGPAPPPKTPSAPKWVEQGVDEIIHLKMCQSIIDTEVPSTMVLATGDGAVAEMSDGFLAHVERALKKGWKVELISWAQQTNGGYKNRKFRAKWGAQFQIIELDGFLEDLIDTL